VGVALTTDAGKGLQMVVSLPKGYDVKAALERLTPALHAAVKGCEAEGSTLALDGQPTLSMQIEGTAIQSVEASKTPGLSCIAQKLKGTALAAPMPSKVQVYLLFREVAATK
jgi:hypothetical protein